MLFALTGEIQTGKTRWLEQLVRELQTKGIECAGVLAPGVWKERVETDSGADGTAGKRFEKLGIDNLLLPDGTRIRFADRRDVSRAACVPGSCSQAERAGLGWAIYDEAIQRVNRHFDELAKRLRQPGSQPGRSLGSNPDPNDVIAVDGCAAPCPVDQPGAGHPAGNPDAGLRRSHSSAPAPALLIVDELGRLELMQGEGLTSAMRLLDAGPTAAFPHALVVVRADLLPLARQRLEGTWGALEPIAPDDAGKYALMRELQAAR